MRKSFFLFLLLGSKGQQKYRQKDDIEDENEGEGEGRTRRRDACGSGQWKDKGGAMMRKNSDKHK